MSNLDQKPVRVLVVDDSEVFLNVLAEVAAATPGFEVVGRASSGREAVDLVAALDAQFVLMDVLMPEMDGIETARRIPRYYPDVVVLLLTASKQAVLEEQSVAVEDNGTFLRSGLPSSGAGTAPALRRRPRDSRRAASRPP